LCLYFFISTTKSSGVQAKSYKKASIHFYQLCSILLMNTSRSYSIHFKSVQKKFFAWEKVWWNQPSLLLITRTNKYVKGWKTSVNNICTSGFIVIGDIYIHKGKAEKVPQNEKGIWCSNKQTKKKKWNNSLLIQFTKKHHD
jgi:hypothetical protein